MKKIIVLINLIFLNQFSLFSQEDKLALDLLNSMSDNYKKMKGFTSSFTYSMKNLTEDITDSFSGKISCLLYTSPSPRDRQKSRMPSSA